MSRSPICLATENGKRVRRVAKAKRLAAAPATEAARLRRCLARIRAEAEAARKHAEASEAVLSAAMLAAGGEDRIVALAVARHAYVECRHSHRFSLLIAYCEMAEEGNLCA